MTLEEFNQFVKLGVHVFTVEIGEDFKPRVKESLVIGVDLINKGRFIVKGRMGFQSYKDWYLTEEQAVTGEILNKTEESDLYESIKEEKKNKEIIYYGIY